MFAVVDVVGCDAYKFVVGVLVKLVAGFLPATSFKFYPLSSWY